MFDLVLIPLGASEGSPLMGSHLQARTRRRVMEIATVVKTLPHLDSGATASSCYMPISPAIRILLYLELNLDHSVAVPT